MITGIRAHHTKLPHDLENDTGQVQNVSMISLARIYRDFVCGKGFWLRFSDHKEVDLSYFGPDSGKRIIIIIVI